MNTEDLLLFGFANGLLLALFAAAVVDFGLAWRRSGGPVPALRFLWHEEHLLFGSWGEARRLRFGQYAFCLGLVLYEFTVVFCNSMAREQWPWLQAQLSPVLDTVMYLAFFAKILLGTRYNWRSLGVAGALYFIARWVYFNGQNIWFLGLAVVLLAAKDVPLRRAMKAFLGCGVPTLALVEILHFAGIVAPGATSERDGSFRLMFGYGHPNTFGGIVFGLVLAWVLLRQAKLCWLEIAAVAAVGVFLQVGPASRSAALCTLLLAVLLAGARLAKSRPAGKLGASLVAALVPLEVGVSLILPLFVVKIGPWANEIGPAWLKRLDDLLTCRISLSWAAYRMYDIKIAGQMLMDWPVLDNIFAYLLYQFGPVMLALVVILLMAALYGHARCGRWQEVACLIAVLLYGYMETQVLHITSDPAALLLCGAIFALPRARWDTPTRT